MRGDRKRKTEKRTGEPEPPKEDTGEKVGRRGGTNEGGRKQRGAIMGLERIEECEKGKERHQGLIPCEI